MRSAAGVCRSCRSEAEQYYADSRCHYAWPIAFAVHYRSTGRETCCEPRQRYRTFYSKLLPISAAAIQQCGCSLVPLQIYFEGSWVKALLDIAKGKT